MCSYTKKNRGKHFFDHIIEFLPTRAERLELNQALNYEIQRGTLNMADVFEIKQIKSKKVAFAVMSERIEMRMKESQKYEMDKSNNMQNGNIMATQARAESDMQVAQLEFQLKAQLEDLKHKHRMAELQAQKELEFISGKTINKPIFKNSIICSITRNNHVIKHLI